MLRPSSRRLLAHHGVGVVAASFQVVSGSERTTTVPTGATTGPVVVVTPNATFAANGNFVVP